VYKAVLVENDIELGKRILTALDSARILVTGALWLYAPQIEEWHLIIATPLVDQKGNRSAFMTVWHILKRYNLLDPAPLRRIFLVSSHDDLIATLRRAYGPPHFPSEFRLTAAYFGNLSIEDAYIYRLAPFQPHVK